MSLTKRMGARLANSSPSAAAGAAGVAEAVAEAAEAAAVEDVEVAAVAAAACRGEPAASASCRRLQQKSAPLRRGFFGIAGRASISVAVPPRGIRAVYARASLRNTRACTHARV
jgi:hypothetical protein